MDARSVAAAASSSWGRDVLGRGGGRGGRSGGGGCAPQVYCAAARATVNDRTTRSRRRHPIRARWKERSPGPQRGRPGLGPCHCDEREPAGRGLARTVAAGATAPTTSEVALLGCSEVAGTCGWRARGRCSPGGGVDRVVVGSLEHALLRRGMRAILVLGHPGCEVWSGRVRWGESGKRRGSRARCLQLGEASGALRGAVGSGRVAILEACWSRRPGAFAESIPEAPEWSAAYNEGRAGQSRRTSGCEVSRWI